MNGVKNKILVQVDGEHVLKFFTVIKSTGKSWSKGAGVCGT